MEMIDFYAMKRKKLQALCKKNGIPANLKNVEMAHRLSFIFKGIENSGSLQLGSDDAGTAIDLTFKGLSGKDMLNVEILDSDSSNDTNNIQMVDSDIVAGDVDSRKEKFASSGKISPIPGLEQKSSDIETNLPHERVIENGLSEEKVDDSTQECLHSAPDVVVMDEVDLVPVASKEFANHLVEAEAEKLSGTGKAEPESEKKDHDTYSPQESNRSDLNLLQVSPEDFGHPLVEGQVHKDTNGKTNVTAEKFLVEVHSFSLEDSHGTPDQILLNNPLSEGKSSDLNVHQMVASGTASGNADVSEKKFVSSQKICLSSEERIDNSQNMVVPGTAIRNEDTREAKLASSQKLIISPASEKMLGFSPKQIHNLETSRKDNLAVYDVEENMQVGVNKEQVEEFGIHLEEGEVEKLGDKIDLLDDVCGTGERGDEAVEQGSINSPQGSNTKDVNLHVSPEESEQVQKSDDSDFHGGFYNLGNSESEVDILRLLDATIASMDTDGKSNVTAEHFPDEVHSSSVEYSDGTTDRILTTHPQGEVMSNDPNIHQMLALDTWEEMLKSSQKEAIIADPEECIGFFPNNLEASATKGEVTRMFKNSDVHDDSGGTGAEEDNQPYTLSHKRKKSDMNTNKKPDEFVPTMPQPGEMNSYTSNIYQSFASDTCEEMLKSSQKSGTIADQEEHIEFFPNNFEASATRGFEAETYFGSSTLGVVVGACNTEKECGQKECNLVQGEVTRMFDDSDVHDLAGGTGLEEENQPYALSRKRKKSDMDSLEKYSLNEFQPVDNTGGQNSNEKPDEFVPTMFQPAEMKSCTSNMHHSLGSGTFEEMLKSSQKEAIIADSVECLGFFDFPSNLEASATKGFEARRQFDPSILGDIVGACNMKETMQSHNMEKESGQKMFDNYDVHDDGGGTRAEENQPYTLSRKRKMSDMDDSLENFFLNEFEPVENASGQNLNEKKPDEFVPTMSQPGEMNSHTSNIYQPFASDTASGDEVTCQEKLESPQKVTPTTSSKERTFFSPKLLQSSMMNKENINIDKKEHVGTITSKNKFLKRQPLQDLQQN